MEKTLHYIMKMRVPLNNKIFLLPKRTTIRKNKDKSRLLDYFFLPICVAHNKFRFYRYKQHIASHNTSNVLDAHLSSPSINIFRISF